jgi:predicted CoA-binding protein
MTSKYNTKYQMKKTVVLGATPDSSRFAFKAAKMLLGYGHEMIPVGIKKGQIEGITIRNDQPILEEVDTITLYVGPKNQEPLYDYIINLKPKRIIFNPGTENDELIELALQNNIEPVIGCTLVMLSVGTY